MAKKHKHEEHVNHERWLVSFADMMTLLFALFVVLYALGQADLAKLKDLKDSVRWAFHIEGEGKTKDEGLFERQAGGGEVIDAAPLITAQDGEMKEFLKDQLERYEEVAGKSLEIVQTDDSISFKTALSDFFAPNQPYPIKSDIAGWLDRTIAASLAFASNIRVVISTPDVLIGHNSRKQAVTSVDLCIERLQTIERFVLAKPEIRREAVTCQWQRQVGSVQWKWEEEATISVVFTNAAATHK